MARPVGRIKSTTNLWQQLPVPLTEAYRTTSDGLTVTVALPEVRLAFATPEGEAASGAKQPSAVVVFQTSKRKGKV